MPILLTPNATTCRVLPFALIEFGEGWSGGIVGDLRLAPFANSVVIVAVSDTPFNIS